LLITIYTVSEKAWKKPTLISLKGFMRAIVRLCIEKMDAPICSKRRDYGENCPCFCRISLVYFQLPVSVQKTPFHFCLRTKCFFNT